MKVSLNWLRRYISLDDKTIDRLENVFPLLGLEIEGLEKKGFSCPEGVIVGEILSSEKHPNADLLSVCRVLVNSSEEPKIIVCGAKNYKVGDRVPVALPGTKLPGDFTIKKSKIRGVESDGMLCSSKELGLSEESEGLLILQDVPPIGIELKYLFASPDLIFDLSVTPNRSDCLSHFGIARELSAVLGIPVKEPETVLSRINFDTFDWSIFENKQCKCDSQPVCASDCSLNLTGCQNFSCLSNLENSSFEKNQKISDKFKGVEIQTEKCPLYLACEIRNVNVCESPDWLKSCLESLGLKSINNIVDVTNFVLMELGQPLHAFDSDKISGNKLIVRFAKEDEKLVLFDEQICEFQKDDMIISDEKNPLVLAGIMGGINSGISDRTKNIVLESAYFDPISIYKSSRRLRISSESSMRFARGVDPSGVEKAFFRAIELILEVSGGSIQKPMFFGQKPENRKEIEISLEYIVKKCGFELSESEITDIFKRLNFEYTSQAKNAWIVTPPSYKIDVLRPIDLVEELLRIYGCDKIPLSNVNWNATDLPENPEFKHLKFIRQYMSNQGFFECYNYSLRSQRELERFFSSDYVKCLALENFLTTDNTHIRPTLILGLLDNLQYNLNRLNKVEKLFEIGHVFRTIDNHVFEFTSLAFVMRNFDQKSWDKQTKVDFYDAKLLTENILKMLGIFADLNSNFSTKEESLLWSKNHSIKKTLAMKDLRLKDVNKSDLNKISVEIDCGILNPEILGDWDLKDIVFAGEITFLSEILKEKSFTQKKFSQISSYPPVTKDLSLIVDKDVQSNIVLQDVSKVIKSVVKDQFEVESVNIFDIYQEEKSSQKSIGISMTFRSNSRTLKDDEISRVFEDIQKEVKYQVRNS